MRGRSCIDMEDSVLVFRDLLPSFGERGSLYSREGLVLKISGLLESFVVIDEDLFLTKVIRRKTCWV